MPAPRVVAAVAALLVFGGAATACADSAKPSASGSARVGPCRAGEPVGSPKSGALPTCAALEPQDSVYAYACAAPAGTPGAKEFFIAYLPTTVLYGRPGGVWHEGPANLSFAKIRTAIGC